MNTAASREILLVAVDPSADRHGARVLRELSRNFGARAFGLGGAELRAAGLEVAAAADRLRAVGVSEAARGAWDALRLWRELERQVRRRGPAAALLMDAPDFNLPLARRLNKLGLPVIYYIAPQVWAWRQGRVRKIKRRVGRLCVILPFEEDFFRRFGIEAEYVGHPLLEEEMAVVDRRPGRVLLLAGSRRREVERLLPLLMDAAALIEQANPRLIFQVPLAQGVDAAWVKQIIEQRRVAAEVRPEGARACLGGARFALCASGTVTLEAALAGVPQVVCYRLSRTSYLLARLLVRVKHICLVNLLLGFELVPEFVQGRARPHILARAAQGLLDDGERRDRMLEGYRRLRDLLGGKRPSERVARIIGETTGW